MALDREDANGNVVSTSTDRTQAEKAIPKAAAPAAAPPRTLGADIKGVANTVGGAVSGTAKGVGS